jgi:hypothetical protein
MHNQASGLLKALLIAAGLNVVPSCRALSYILLAAADNGNTSGKRMLLRSNKKKFEEKERMRARSLPPDRVSLPLYTTMAETAKGKKEGMDTQLQDYAIRKRGKDGGNGRVSCR